MKRIVLAALLAVLSLPAVASEAFFCEGEGVETHFPMAGGVAFAVMEGTTISIDGTVAYSSDTSLGGIQISAAEGFSGNHRIEMDFTDVDYMEVVAEVRLFWTEEESDPVYGGILRIPGRGTWPISCQWG